MVLPGAVIFLWLVCSGRWKLLLEMKIPTGTALFLLITVPWHIMVWQHNPEHPHFYFIHEHLERYTTTVHGRYQPFWFFGVVLLAGLFPWIFFAYPALRSGFVGAWSERKNNGNSLFLALWIGFILLFFSVSDSKLIPYILPVFPPLAAVIGNYLAHAWNERPMGTRKKGAGFTLAMMLMLLALVAIAAMPMVLRNLLDPESKAIVAIEQGGDAIQLFSITALISAIALFITFVQGRYRHVIIVFSIIAAAIMQLGDLVAANYNKDSMQPFAEIIKSVQKPDDEIASYDTYYQDLPIYLNHRITVVNWKGELEFGTQNEDTSAWMIEYDEFWKRWLNPDHRMFVVMREDAFERIQSEKKNIEENHMYPLQHIGRNILFSNVNPTTFKEKKH